MPYLFAITVAAFVALLWAAFSAAQHIRRARRRRKLAWNAPLPDAHTSEAAASLDPWLEPEAVPAEPHAPPPFPEPQATAAPDKQPIRFPLSSQRPVRFTEAPPPPPAHQPESPTATPIAPRPNPLRRPPASVTPASRPDWGYFNDQAGDLSDPVAAPRLKDRNRR